MTTAGAIFICQGETELLRGKSLSLDILHWVNTNECRSKKQGQIGVRYRKEAMLPGHQLKRNWRLPITSILLVCQDSSY